MRILEYRLTSDALCLGHRIRGGLYRPCDTRVIRYSAITGALRPLLSAEVHATGYFVQQPPPVVRHWVYAPRDRATGVSKVPITVQYLGNVEGRVYIVNASTELSQEVDFSMGAMKSQGFGRCRMWLIGEAQTRRVAGSLQTRLPEDLAHIFEITPLQPRFGYLFQPNSISSGVYVRSLFEDSFVEGPECLVQEDGNA